MPLTEPKPIPKGFEMRCLACDETEVRIILSFGDPLAFEWQTPDSIVVQCGSCGQQWRLWRMHATGG
jgi:hypothetical protein